MTDTKPIYEQELTVGPVTIRATVDVIQGETYSTLTLEQLDHEGRLRVVTAVMDYFDWGVVSGKCAEAWWAIKQQSKEEAA